jgi:hypothetical protein
VDKLFCTAPKRCELAIPPNNNKKKSFYAYKKGKLAF